MRLKRITIPVVMIIFSIPLGIYAQERDIYTELNSQFETDYFVISLGTEETEPNLEPLPLFAPELRFVVNIPARHLTIYENGHATDSYPVTIGQNIYRTPVGAYRISRIVWNPWWFPPDSKWAKDEVDTPPGPRNPLGKVKIPLGGALLLHGTNQPASIGRPLSHGCMRMHNEDIISLAGWLQQEFSEHADDATALRHSQRWYRYSYVVPLTATLPFEIVYRPIEIQGDVVVFYPNVYGYSHDLYEDLTATLSQVGIAPADIDLDHVPDGLPRTEPVRIPIAALLRRPDDRVAAQHTLNPDKLD